MTQLCNDLFGVSWDTKEGLGTGVGVIRDGWNSLLIISIP